MEGVQERNQIIDILKGVGIICMVAGHCNAPFKSFIYLFHMAVFFMASGFLYKDENSKDMVSVYHFISKKIKTLWVPYVFWITVFSLFHNLLININIYTNNIEFLNYVSGINDRVMSYCSVKDILINIIKACLLHGGTQLTAGFWFIATLFEISILYCVFDFVLGQLCKREDTFIYQSCISVVFLCVGFTFSKLNIFIWGIERAFSYYILYNLGYGIKKYNIMEKILKVKYVMFLLFVILVLLNYFGEINLDRNSYESPCFLLVVSSVGWAFLYVISNYILNLPKGGYVLSFVGKNSLSILILHLLSFKLVNMVGVIFQDKPMFLIAAFPVLYRDSYWWIFYLIIGIGVPLLLTMIYKVIKDKIINILRKDNL